MRSINSHSEIRSHISSRYLLIYSYFNVSNFNQPFNNWDESSPHMILFFDRVNCLHTSNHTTTSLVAMSSSRSDDVTKSVCLKSFCLVLIIQSIWSKIFWGSCKGISGASIWCLNEVSRMFQGSFKGVNRKLGRIPKVFK